MVNLLDYIPSTRRPTLAGVLNLAKKGQSHTTDDNTVLLVHRPHTDSTRHARDTPPPPLDPPPRVYVPTLVRPWVLRTCHSTTSCHLGVSRTLSMPRRFYWWVVMDISTRWWLRPLPQVPGEQGFAPNNSLAYPFLVVTKRLRHSRQRVLLWPPTFNASRQRLHTPFYGPLQPRADMYATPEAQFTASGTADILVDRYIPL